MNRLWMKAFFIRWFFAGAMLCFCACGRPDDFWTDADKCDALVRWVDSFVAPELNLIVRDENLSSGVLFDFRLPERMRAGIPEFMRSLADDYGVVGRYELEGEKIKGFTVTQVVFSRHGVLIGAVDVNDGAINPYREFLKKSGRVASFYEVEFRKVPVVNVHGIFVASPDAKMPPDRTKN